MSRFCDSSYEYRALTGRLDIIWSVNGWLFSDFTEDTVTRDGGCYDRLVHLLVERRGCYDESSLRGSEYGALVCQRLMGLTNFSKTTFTLIRAARIKVRDSIHGDI